MLTQASPLVRLILREAEKRIQQGTPRQKVCDLLLSSSLSMGEFLGLDSHRREPTLQFQEASLRAQDILFDVMLQRNLAAESAERNGDILAAITLYEANVADHFVGSHPYERLRVLYSKRKDYHEALRVMMALKEVTRQPEKKAKADKKIDKLWSKLEAAQQR